MGTGGNKEEGILHSKRREKFRQEYLIDTTACVDCVETPLKEHGILSVDARSSPRESIGSATTRWPVGTLGDVQKVRDRVY